jgi:general stress protein 26
MHTHEHTEASGSAAQLEHKLHELVRSFDTAMLVTHTPQGAHARPMAVADVTAPGELWFVARDDSPKAAEIQADQRVLVTMQSGAKQVAVYGHARLERDARKVQELWREAWRVWFDDKNDPRIVLIHVRPDEAEYWDNSGSAGLKFFVKAAAAYVSGKEMRDVDDPKVHARLKV